MRTINLRLTEYDQVIRAEIKCQSRLDYPTIDAILMNWALRNWRQISAFRSPMDKFTDINGK